MKKHILILIAVVCLQPLKLLAAPSDELIKAALERTTHQVTYDGSYHAIKYPGGDVPSNIGAK